MHVQRMKDAKKQTLHGTHPSRRPFGGLFDHEQIEIAPIAGGADRIGSESPHDERSVRLDNPVRDSSDIIFGQHGSVD